MPELLTMAIAEEKCKTAVDLVKYFRPDWTDEECDFYLWEHTCYPFSLEGTIRQLNTKLLTS